MRVDNHSTPLSKMVDTQFLEIKFVGLQTPSALLSVNRNGSSMPIILFANHKHSLTAKYYSCKYTSLLSIAMRDHVSARFKALKLLKIT